MLSVDNGSQFESIRLDIMIQCDTANLYAFFIAARCELFWHAAFMVFVSFWPVKQGSVSYVHNVQLKYKLSVVWSSCCSLVPNCCSPINVLPCTGAVPVNSVTQCAHVSLIDNLSFKSFCQIIGYHWIVWWCCTLVFVIDTL